jgi:hypothetical protein
MVNNSFTGSHSTQQFDRTAVGFVDDYLARVCASYRSYIFQPDLNRAYLTQEKIEEHGLTGRRFIDGSRIIMVIAVVPALQ